MFDSSLSSRQSADNQPQSVKPKLVTCFVLSARKLNGYVVFDLRSSNRICLQLSRCKQGFRSLSDRMTWQMRACCMQCVQHCSTAAVSPWLGICSAHLILLHHHRHSILVKMQHTKTNMLNCWWPNEMETINRGDWHKRQRCIDKSKICSAAVMTDPLPIKITVQPAVLQCCSAPVLSAVSALCSL